MCVTPSFLAKLTDHSPEIQALLQFRAYKLFNWHPQGSPQPDEPPGYSQLEWAPPLAEVENLEGNYRKHMASKPKNRTVVSVKRYAWYFSDWQPGNNIGS